MSTRGRTAARSAKAMAQKVSETLRSSAQTLDPGMRSYFEPRFGYDFSRVRVHADPRAEESAKSVNALAYAANQHIVLGRGAPSMTSRAGRELLAHELAHVVQQSSRPASLFAGLRRPVTVRKAGDEFEREASREATRVLSSSGRAASTNLRSLTAATSEPIVIQRQPNPWDVEHRDPMYDDEWRPHGVKGPSPFGPKPATVPDEERAKGAKAKEDKDAEAKELKSKGIEKELKTAILNGDYKDAGEYTQDEAGNFQFTNAKMQQALRYYMLVWAPTVPVLGTAPGSIISDSHAKPIKEHPQWVKEFTIQLMGQQPLPAPGDQTPQLSPKLPPQWSEDSRVAQRLIEAYLRAWDMKINNRYYVNANLGQLYANVGGSITNDRAELFGGVRGWGNWCGPASQNAVALGLMQGGYRFKQKGQPGTNPAIKGNPHSFKMILARPHKDSDDKSEQTKQAYQKEIATAFEQEVRAQGAFFLTNWAKGADQQGKQRTADSSRRTIAGKDAATEKLFPGDFIYIVNGNQGSPLSGHVATVIREVPKPGIELGEKKKYDSGTVLSTLYWISGNSKGVVSYEGAIRPEQIQREMPHKDYAYFETAGWGNQFDLRKTQETNIEREGRQKYDGKLQKEFAKVLSVIMTRRRTNPSQATMEDIRATLERKAEGEYFIVYKYNQAKMQALFDHFGVSFSGYQELLDQRNKDIVPRLTAAQANTEAYVKERVDANQPYTTKPDYDPKFEQKNISEKGKENTGRYKPLIDDHSWVVSIVRSDQLDPSRLRKEMSEELSFQNGYKAPKPGAITGDYSGASFAEVAAAAKAREQVETKVLDKYGLEPMPGTIEDLWPGAIEYWDRRGAFK